MGTGLQDPYYLLGLARQEYEEAVRARDLAQRKVDELNRKLMAAELAAKPS